MTGSERRDAILAALETADAPLSGAALGKRFDVSRQVVVQDVALLRSQGARIEATPKGYVLDAPAATRLMKLRHTMEEAADELNTIVDLGGTVEDVVVNHRTYGLMSAQLGIRNRRDVQRYLDEIKAGVSTPLFMITSGYHFHHVSAEDEEVLDEIQAKLDQMGLIAPFTDYELETL